MSPPISFQTSAGDFPSHIHFLFRKMMKTVFCFPPIFSGHPIVGWRRRRSNYLLIPSLHRAFIVLFPILHISQYLFYHFCINMYCFHQFLLYFLGDWGFIYRYYLVCCFIFSYFWKWGLLVMCPLALGGAGVVGPGVRVPVLPRGAADDGDVRICRADPLGGK